MTSTKETNDQIVHRTPTSSISSELTEKLNLLKGILKDMSSVAVAYSAGVDSTLLLYIAHEVLGDRMCAITATSFVFPENEKEEASGFTREHGIPLLFFEFRPMEVPGFRENPPSRCYHCKKALFTELLSVAEKQGYAHVAEGTNVDDLSDDRPGLRALEELGIQSPLREAGLTKKDIRELSRQFGLPTWDKPSFACLASRFPYGDPITEKQLSMVGQAEAYLATLGLKQYRVRIHNSLARIEVLPGEIHRLAEPEISAGITARLKQLGFRYVTLDLAGYHG